MKLIIAGSRTIDDLTPYWFRDTLKQFNIECLTLQNDKNKDIDEIVSGVCYGVDRCGESFAKKYIIPIKRFPADWETHGNIAGPLRNKEMAQYADALLLIWDGKSKGSANMKKEMQTLKKPIYEVILKGI